MSLVFQPQKLAECFQYFLQGLGLGIDLFLTFHFILPKSCVYFHQFRSQTNDNMHNNLSRNMIRVTFLRLYWALDKFHLYVCVCTFVFIYLFIYFSVVSPNASRHSSATHALAVHGGVWQTTASAFHLWRWPGESPVRITSEQRPAHSAARRKLGPCHKWSEEQLVNNDYGEWPPSAERQTLDWSILETVIGHVI